MDYGRPELADRLAAGYALGQLRGAARRRFEALLPAHPGLRAALRAWHDRLMPLAGDVAPQQPSPVVWQRIEARIGGASAAAVLPWWRRLGLWQLASALTGGAALGLALLLGTPAPVRSPVLVVLSAAAPGAGAGAGTAAAPSFVASISGDGRVLVTRPIQNVSLQADRSFELWTLPSRGSPRSLGTISPSGTTLVQRQRLLDGTAALAVTLEPPGGSPTGQPTGPVVYVGKLTL